MTDWPHDEPGQREDAECRLRALGLESFIVEAPAGSGKTELLTQRFLRLLATVDEPEEVVALTFTNKAAGEMRDRIVHSLSLALQGECPDEPHRRITFELASAAAAHGEQRGWRLAGQPERLRISTLDALCAGLARQLPLMSRFGFQPGVAEDAGRHYREAARRALDLLEEPGPGKSIARVLDHLDNDHARLVDLLAVMLSRREQWRGVAGLSQPAAAVGAALDELLADELAALTKKLDGEWQQALMPCARYSADNGGSAALQDWEHPLAPVPAEIARWRALADLLLTREGQPRRTADRRLGFPPGEAGKAMKGALLLAAGELGEERLAALQAVRRLPGEGVGMGGDELLLALVELLQLAAAQLWLVFQECGEVDFTELALRASDALGDESVPSELALRLDYAVRHLLVDEFQDTSPAQVGLLARLTAGWQPGDGHTFFAVGDPMQSIYRFRKADVGLFLRVAESGIGNLRLTRLRLLRNNRSAPAVVDWVNRSFADCFPKVDDPLRGQVTYRRCVAGRERDERAGVSLHLLAVDAGDQVHAEAAAVVALIRTERERNPDGVIAILVRARSHLAAIMTELAQQGLRPTAVDIEPLAGRQSVQDLIALTRALLHRGDRLNWLAILRAPWCGLRLDDLHALAGDDHEATIWTLINDPILLERLSPDGATRLAYVRRVMAEAIDGAGRQTLVRRVTDAWRKLGGDALLQDDGEAAAVAMFFRRIEKTERGGRLSWDSLTEELGDLYAPPDPDADERLQVMTIHKSKGLEFDTVILPGLHLAARDRDYPLLAWDTFPFQGGERLVAAPLNARRAKDVPTPYDYLCERERERDRNESLRVLYVGATRAKQRLHLFAAVERTAEGGWRPPVKRSPLAFLTPMFEEALEGMSPAAAAGSSESAAPPVHADFTPRLLRAATQPDNQEWWAPEVVQRMRPVVETIDPTAAELGSLAHACLEQMAASGQLWKPADLPMRVPVLARWLGLRGWPVNRALSGAQRVVGWLEATLRSADGKWVLKPRPGTASELALSRVGAGAAEEGAMVVTRVLDRTFVEDGVRWIVDYKSSVLEGGGEGELAAHAEQYRRQLEGYALLFAGEGLPIRTGVFYLAHGRLVAL